ncbi:IS21 family transposase [Bifidobacterium callitrichos]|nr:IS21 family transposase [Bifidobacterium callitrichos]
MAIPMPIVQDIRRLDRQGLSRAEIARRLCVDRGTVAKYADMEDLSPRRPGDRRYGSKIDEFAAVVDGWLEADRRMPRKQRHTARRVYDRLVSEHGYGGSYSVVQRYVKRWREPNREPSAAFLDLSWAPGTAQVDFGVALAVVAGRETETHCLVVSFPWSNMRLCVAMPGENAECLCAGLMLVFAHVGGVPPVIVMDNATGAGHRNARGEVALTGVFESFVAHHRLEARFCNPYSGHEKGSVENAVGFLRRNIMVPPMRAESYEQLSRLMLERCDELAASSYCPRLMDVPVAQVFAEDRAALAPLPSMGFDPVRWESRRADKRGRIDIDSRSYLAGGAWARRRVQAAVRWDTVTLVDPDTGAVLAEYPRPYGDGPRVLQDPALVMPMLAARPGAWGESPIRPDVPDDIRSWLDSMDERTLRESLKAIAHACAAAGFEPAMQACDEILACNRDMGLHADTLTPIALRMRDGDWEYPGAIEEPDLSGYDEFITGAGHDGEETR